MSTPVTPTKKDLRDAAAIPRKKKKTVSIGTHLKEGAPMYLDKPTTTTETGAGLISDRIQPSEVGAKWEMEPVRRGLVSAFVAFMVVSFVYFFALSDKEQSLLFTFFALLAILAYFAISISSGDAWGVRHKNPPRRRAS